MHTNGDVYNGNWYNDRAHGTGEYRSKDGGVYKGTWVGDK